MNEEEYLKNRVDDQIAWYDRKGAANQSWFQRLRLIEIAAAAAVALLAGYADSFSNVKIVVGILGLITAVIASVLALYHFQENWIAYRSACEALRQEKYLFLTKTEPYEGNNAFPLFVSRVEGLMSKERTAWTQSHPRAEQS